MDQHAKWTFAIANVYAKWAQQVSLYFSAPFNDEGPLPEQPTAEEKDMHLRDAEAHGRMAAFAAAIVEVAGPDAELPDVPEAS